MPVAQVRSIFSAARFALAAGAAIVLSLAMGTAYAGPATGTISGIVKYAAAAPKPKRIEITKDKDVCGRKPLFAQDLIVSKDGGIENAVVVLKGAKGKLKPGTVTFDQKGCEYLPHVLAFEAGGTVNVVNPDGILHSIHAYSGETSLFNKAQPSFKHSIQEKVDKPGVLKITCDVHDWMIGWWYVTDTPHFAVTNAKGEFTIEDVPPGDYTIEAWQEKLGTREQKIDVKAGAATTTDFTFKPKG
ncbi:MAG: carboxypeptidase regulatory-like domain-containing protein [Candidatus Binataceae bacterium]